MKLPKRVWIGRRTDGCLAVATSFREARLCAPVQMHAYARQESASERKMRREREELAWGIQQALAGAA